MTEQIRILVIYDTPDNKRRRKYVKLLNSYGYRVQYSAFEAVISFGKYNKLLSSLEKISKEDDAVAVYRIRNKGDNVYVSGNHTEMDMLDKDIFFI